MPIFLLECKLIYFLTLTQESYIMTVETIDKIEYSKANSHHYGKVRDSFIFNDKRAIVVSDRISAFDFVLGTVPYKGAVLNQLAAWWFKKLDEINVPHHLIDVPSPNVSVVKNVTVLPIEIIVRGYLTGSTKTSSWYAYQNLDRVICGLTMPEGMKKNEQFDNYLITPTTKPEFGHDESITREQIIERGLVTEEIYKQVEAYALKLFTFGQQVAAKQGLILVDTKYEMGLDADGNLLLIDEVHTPDSSRYWLADSYDARLAKGEEPQSLDKEFVRRMMVAAGYDVDSDEDPSKYLTESVANEASARYLDLYKRMTGEAMVIDDNAISKAAIISALDKMA